MPKRPQKRVRPQDFPDHDEFEDIKPRKFKDLDTELEIVVKDCKASPCAYQEGDLVTCPNKSKIGTPGPKDGTVIGVLGQSLLVLDHEGFIHQCKAFEVYPTQK